MASVRPTATDYNPSPNQVEPRFEASHAFPQTQDWLGKAAPDHAQEWLDSGVDPEIVALNVETLTDTATHPNADSLFPIAERLNWNMHRFGHKTRQTLRGWWVSGIDPLTGERMAWGRFKPDANTPIIDQVKGKPAKYLSPSLGPGSSRLILLAISDAIWQRVADRHHLPMPVDRSQGFWHWVKQQQIPIIVTEGEKKAGCLLTLGYAAIALPGIFNGYRKPGILIPELEVFTTHKRAFYICFDFETRPVTVRNINLAITKLGTLLQTSGCSVQVISLPGPQKGVDDVVTAQGANTFHHLYEAALPLGLWQSHQQWRLTYPATLTVNQPYLEDVPYPATGFACLKSAKGTGKTTALQTLIRQATQTGRKVLVITHRIQLGRAICESIGIDWIEDLRDSTTSTQLGALLGYGLCIDSLHFGSQARFNPDAWQGAIVILDEVEQVLWHALNSSTCYEHRVKILETLRELIQVVLNTDGLVIAQDADLSDVSIDYLLGLADQPTTPWLLVNKWQPSCPWQVKFYHTPNPAALITRLNETIPTGAVFIALDSQKARGRWSSKNLESYLQTQFPEKRILRIDSESVADPEHPAYGIVEQLNDQITNYDIVLATPTIGTGVSIDIRGHFKAVFGIFLGVTPDAESRQALARVREPVPRYVWAAPFGPGKIGNGSCHYQDIATSTTRFIKYNLALLKEIDFDIDQQTDPITLRTWAKMAARVNTSLWSFRHQFSQGLQLEGHQITIVTADLHQILTTELKTYSASPESKIVISDDAIPQQLQEDLRSGALQVPGFEFLEQHHPKSAITATWSDISTVRQQRQTQEACAISTAPEIAATDYEALKEQRSKTWQDHCAVQKYELQRKYAIPVTSDLKLKDDEGWFNQLRLHYYLIHGPTLVRARDYKEWQSHLERGGGKIALQDVRLLTAQVEALRNLNILNLLHPNRDIRATDTDVQQIAQHCIHYSEDFKTLLNLTFSERMKPIEIVQALLGKLGLKLSCIRRDRAADGRRGGLRVYQYQGTTDRRELVFTQWQQRDRINEATSTPTSSPDTTSADPPPDISNLNRLYAGSELDIADTLVPRLTAPPTASANSGNFSRTAKTNYFSETFSVIEADKTICSAVSPTSTSAAGQEKTKLKVQQPAFMPRNQTTYEQRLTKN
jgi:hypothetical protein